MRYAQCAIQVEGVVTPINSIQSHSTLLFTSQCLFSSPPSSTSLSVVLSVPVRDYFAAADRAIC